jgi:phosphomannomutase/phosphoglucomutase
MKQVAEHVFRAYDIRGLVDTDFDEAWVDLLGKACGAFWREQKQERCLVGYDCRRSSPAYAAALMEGLLSTGLNVVSLGMVPTPFLYFGINHLACPAGIMVTASHNPAEYNGFKIWHGISTLHSTGLSALRDRMRSGIFPRGRGLGCDCDIFPAYCDAVESRIRLSRRLKVVVDGGNGAGGLRCVALLRALGAEVVPLFCEPDGSFPHHHPDPSVEENMTDLKAGVLAEGADIGIGLDGDADRLGVVDETGRLFFGDELLAVYARDVLTRLPGSTILGDVKCSRRLYEDIARHGGKPAMDAAGHSFIRERMQALKAPVAGEMSGHMFFREGWFGFDDALYGAARLLRILADAGRPLSTFVDWPAAAVTPELFLPCPDAWKKRVVAKAAEYFSARCQTVLLDGVRLEFPDAWALVRASNTRPALTLRFEAPNGQHLAALRRLVEDPLRIWLEETAAESHPDTACL